MKITVKVGLVLAAIWIIFKIVLMYLGKSDQGFTVGIFLNILFILLAASIGLYFTKLRQKEPAHFLSDVKVSLQGSIVYTLIISLFVYVYYEKIDPFVMQNRIDEKVAAAEYQARSEEAYLKIQTETPSLREVNKEEYVQLVKEDAELLHSGFVQSTFTLIALMLASIVYAFLVTFVFRKIIFR